MTTIADQLGLMRRGDVSAAELAEQALASATQNAHLGAWELVDADGARVAARAADRRRRDGDDGPLLGVPVAVKDMIDVAGLPTRAGSAAWSRSPSRDAGAVAALRAAGAVVVGKTFTVEWAYGIDGLNPHRPPCLNPRAHDRLPGGSSSGSAAAVAAGIVAGALGTDTSGSVRVPAAFCGIVGLRPTFGAVPIDGVIPLAPSYDVVGPMATSVADIALLLAVLTGRDDGVLERWRGAPPRIGIVESLLAPGVCDPGIAATVRALVARIEERGARVDSVAIPGLERAVPLHRTIQLREAADTHGALRTDPASVAAPVRQRLVAGAALDAETVAEARRERAQLAAAIDAALATRDALLGPGVTMPPPLRSAADQAVASAGAAAAIGGMSVPLRDALQAAPVPFTQHGGPVLALPAGTADGLPVGVQLVGRRGSDRSLLALAAAYVEEASASSVRSSPGSVTGRRHAKPSQR
jgi:aspartyl-tRNA(Asn)/glutamyl-tRNA(Gln) amidotransferase subunit A